MNPFARSASLTARCATSHRFVRLAILGLIGIAGSAAAVLPLRIEEAWSNVIGARELTLHVLIHADPPGNARLTWGFTAGSGIISRGEQHLDAPGAHRVAITLAVPPVRPGVVLPVLFAGDVTGSDGQLLGSFSRELFVYHENPFTARADGLQALDLHLFDPAGPTAALFTSLGVAFSPVYGIDQLSAVETGLLVVGEGLHLADHRHLIGELITAAKRGVDVLVLSPAGGTFVLPGSADPAQTRPPDLHFRRNEVVRLFDKRLDADAWPPDGTLLSRSLTLLGAGREVACEIVTTPNHWAWLEVDYRRPGGRLVLTTIPVIDRWEAGAAPRYALWGMLENLNQKGEQR